MFGFGVVFCLFVFLFLLCLYSEFALPSPEIIILSLLHTSCHPDRSSRKLVPRVLLSKLTSSKMSNEFSKGGKVFLSPCCQHIQVGREVRDLILPSQKKRIIHVNKNEAQRVMKWVGKVSFCWVLPRVQFLRIRGVVF